MNHWKELEKSFKISDLYKLNWIEIMRDAIDYRPTSWTKNPIVEWRNASDTVNMAVVHAIIKILKESEKE